MPRPPDTRLIADRLALHSKPHESGCILWTGGKCQGYGRLRCAGRVRNAHVVAWIDAKGEIPTGLFVCHTCDVRNCINVDHLFLGTLQDNHADMVAKGRHSRGESRSKFMAEVARKSWAARRMRMAAINYSITEG